jgi:hypothetical protein
VAPGIATQRGRSWRWQQKILRSRSARVRGLAIVPSATVVGVLAAVVKFFGLARWPFLVPTLARKYDDPASSEAARAATVVVFESFRTYLGVLALTSRRGTQACLEAASAARSTRGGWKWPVAVWRRSPGSSPKGLKWCRRRSSARRRLALPSARTYWARRLPSGRAIKDRLRPLWPRQSTSIPNRLSGAWQGLLDPPVGLHLGAR